MQIHVVRTGETLYGIARQYGVSPTLLGRLNQVPAGGALAVVVYEPERVHVVRPGETLAGIARRESVTTLSLYQNNYFLGGQPDILPDEELIVALKGEKSGTLAVNGYAYPFIGQALLRTVLPYMTYLTPFTYGITAAGGLVIPDDGWMLAAAAEYQARPWMHLSTLTAEGRFDSRLGGALLENAAAQAALIDAIAANMAEKGYQGLDVDFEYLEGRQAAAYAAFIAALRQRLNPLGWPVIVALAPKSSAGQKGLLYEGHDYAALGRAADGVLLMTYEWGYTAGPPMAAPGAAGAGLRADGDPPGEDLSGCTHLRLRLAAALPAGHHPRALPVAAGGAGAGPAVRRGDPVRRNGPVPVVPVYGGDRYRPRGVVRGCPFQPCQIPSGGGKRLTGRGAVEPDAGRAPDISGAERRVRHRKGGMTQKSRG